MDGWIVLIILYIIFMAIGSLIKKNRSLGIPQPNKKEKTQEDLQAKFERYADKIGDYFSEKKPPPLPQQKPQESKILLIPKTQRLDLYPPETLPKSPTVRRLVQEEIPLPELRLSSFPKPAAAPKTPSILSFDKHQSYVQGIIMSEILGPPVSKKRRRR